jgi:beta-galactosidase
MQLGVCYYPEQWPESYWQSDAARMVDMGISHVRIAEFAWSRMEPHAGQFDWAWLDRAVDTLQAAGLKIIMCTPTTTPPKWLVDSDPSMLAVDANNQPKRFGSRRHYCFSSAAYRAQSRRITKAIAQRYGKHPAVVAWQTDNEYGCHFTVQSFSHGAHQGFRRWLQSRYGSIEQLNAIWGTAFWSQSYTSFDQIDPPLQTVTEAHPALRLDWRRFGSDEVVSFNREQVDILREASPGRLITHNFMGFFTEFDHYKVSKDLDVAAYDSYPIGFTQMFFLNAEEKKQWAEVGHPDIPSFHYDLYRGMCAQGKWWVMEQQPGPVNWAHWNPIPKDGMVRLWTWQAMMHGCDLVSYFRWRQTPFAQEQLHAGLLAPDSSKAQGAVEVKQLSSEIKQITQRFPAGIGNVQASVALVFDYDTMWMAEIQPQGQDYNALELVFRIYSSLRALGLNVDIVSADAELSGYRMVVLAAQWHVTAQLQEQLENSKTHIVIAPRAGSKSAHMSIAQPLPPGGLTALAGVTVKRIGSLPPALDVTLFSANTAPGSSPVAKASRWAEDLQCTGAQPLWVNAQGAAMVTRMNKVTYVGAWLDDADWQKLFKDVCELAQVPTQTLAVGLRLSAMGPLILAANFSDAALVWQPTPAMGTGGQATQILLGDMLIPPQGIAIWQVY